MLLWQKLKQNDFLQVLVPPPPNKKRKIHKTALTFCILCITLSIFKLSIFAFFPTTGWGIICLLVVNNLLWSITQIRAQLFQD